MGLAALADLGMGAEAALSGADRPRQGNQLFGGFGRDFATADGQRVLIMALTRRHWTDLVKALAIGAEIERLQERLETDFSADESARFIHREALNAIVAPAVAGMTSDRLAAAFAGTAVCWAPYNSLSNAIGPGRPISTANPQFFPVEHPGGHAYPTPAGPVFLDGIERRAPRCAPRLGEHTDEILAEVLGLSDGQIGGLHDEGLAAGPGATTRTA